MKFIALDDYEAIAIALHLGHTDEEVKRAQRELLAASAAAAAGRGTGSTTTTYIGADRRTLLLIDDVVDYVIRVNGYK